VVPSAFAAVAMGQDIAPHVLRMQRSASHKPPFIC
jgi:hypothetical protein